MALSVEIHVPVRDYTGRKWQVIRVWNFMNLQSALNMLSHIVSLFCYGDAVTVMWHRHAHKGSSVGVHICLYFTISETVNQHSQIAKYLQQRSVFTSHNWGQCMISNARIFLLFNYMHTPPHRYRPKCTFWCLTAANKHNLVCGLDQYPVIQDIKLSSL